MYCTVIYSVQHLFCSKQKYSQSKAMYIRLLPYEYEYLQITSNKRKVEWSECNSSRKRGGRAYEHLEEEELTLEHLSHLVVVVTGPREQLGPLRVRYTSSCTHVDAISYLYSTYVLQYASHRRSQCLLILSTLLSLLKSNPIPIVSASVHASAQAHNTPICAVTGIRRLLGITPNSSTFDARNRHAGVSSHASTDLSPFLCTYCELCEDGEHQH